MKETVVKQTVEIERRWLVEEENKHFAEIATIHHGDIDQRYIAVDASNKSCLRLRRYGGKDEVEMTIKQGSGLSKPEHNQKLPLTGAISQLWGDNEHRSVHKNRSHLHSEVPVVEFVFDEFKAALEGLYIVEVEFDSEEQARSYVPLAWFGVEITDDIRYTNAELAVTQKIPERQ